MIVAMMESESFTWIALGKNEREAKNAILKKWNELQKDKWFEPEYYNNYRDLDDYYGISLWELNPGECDV